jgi:stearoyl-CoA desaturase (delta-9 desaturase)
MTETALRLDTSARAGLPLPSGVRPLRIARVRASVLTFYHLVGLLALLPWFFSWTGVVLAFLGHYAIGALGISLCYHRLLTHRGFVCPLWLEHGLAILGVCCVQDTPARWAAIHRKHHHYSDNGGDPHSPAVNFLWGHMGWLFLVNRELNPIGMFDRYARDILRDPFYAAMERTYLYVWLNLLSWLVFFGGGLMVGLIAGESIGAASQFGASLLVWGVFVRTVVHWHATWSVNSVTHRWGYRNYVTGEDSRNNVLIGLVANGEGWHNNHHADPRSARHGHKWWELDTTYLAVRALGALGLAREIAEPSANLNAEREG